MLSVTSKIKDTIILDDMVDTGGTTIQAAAALKEKGARRVLAACTHAVLSGNAIEKVNGSVLGRADCNKHHTA